VHTPLCLQVSGCPEVEDDKESGALVKKLLMKVLGFCSETVIRAWHLDEPDGRRPGADGLGLHVRPAAGTVRSVWPSGLVLDQPGGECR